MRGEKGLRRKARMLLGAVSREEGKPRGSTQAGSRTKCERDTALSIEAPDGPRGEE